MNGMKGPLNRPLDSPPTSIMVFCFVVGTKITNAFRVRGEAVMTIDELREMIYEKNRNDFTSKGFDANKLDLWKVNIPGDAENAKNLKPLESRRDIDDENVIIKNLGGKQLTPFENFGDIFENDYNDSKNIRIIAQPPPPPATTVLEGNRKKMKTDAKLPYTPRQGGIGGTIFLTTEGDGVGSYEGIDLNSSDICRREQTIHKLVEKIEQARFLLVRSPPMFGKTSLGQLLEQHLVKDSNIRVIRISLIWMGNPSGPWTFEEGFQRLMGITWQKFQEECVYIKTIFIVDEVQMLYVPQGEPETASYHNGNVFWETIKRCQQIGNLNIVAFAAYGYKGAWDYSSATCTIDVSPFTIPRENTWGIEDVRFTEDEYGDYFLRFCNAHLKNINEDGVKYLHEYVYNTTAGHPGLVAFFMDNIRKHFFPQLKYGDKKHDDKKHDDRKHDDKKHDDKKHDDKKHDDKKHDDNKLTFERIFLYLKSHEFMIEVDQGFRGYLLMQKLTTEEEELCDKVFRGPISIRQLYNISGEEKRLVRTNLLSEQNGKLDFASPYLRALYLQRRWGCTIRSTNPPQNFKSFLRGTFTNMNAETIRNSYCVGTDNRLLERAWQMEFYRAATQVLPADIFISPDVGTYWWSSGYVDFFVGGSRRWTIELLRDGEAASKHKHRFETIYEPIKKISKEWAIIDIRQPGLRNKAPAYRADRNWINVYCQKNWESVIIEDKDEKVEVRLIGR